MSSYFDIQNINYLEKFEFNIFLIFTLFSLAIYDFFTLNQEPRLLSTVFGFELFVWNKLFLFEVGTSCCLVLTFSSGFCSLVFVFCYSVDHGLVRLRVTSTYSLQCSVLCIMIVLRFIVLSILTWLLFTHFISSNQNCLRLNNFPTAICYHWILFYI